MTVAKWPEKQSTVPQTPRACNWYLKLSHISQFSSQTKSVKLKYYKWIVMSNHISLAERALWITKCSTWRSLMPSGRALMHMSGKWVTGAGTSGQPQPTVLVCCTCILPSFARSDQANSSEVLCHSSQERIYLASPCSWGHRSRDSHSCDSHCVGILGLLRVTHSRLLNGCFLARLWGLCWKWHVTLAVGRAS